MKNTVPNDNEASNENTSAEISRRVLGRRAFLKGALATAPLLNRRPYPLAAEENPGCA